VASDGGFSGNNGFGVGVSGSAAAGSNMSLKDFKYQYDEKEELSKRELLNQEREMTGIYISGHPLDNFRKIIEEQANFSSNDIGAIIEGSSDVQDGKSVKVIGIINHIKKLYTKRNTEMAFMSIEDLYGSIEVVLFDRLFAKVKSEIDEADIIVVEGKISIKDEEHINIIADNVYKIEADKYFGKTFEIDITGLSREEKDKLKVLIRTFNNKKNNVNIQVNDNGKVIPCGKMFLDDEVYKKFEVLRRDGLRII